MKKYIFFLGGSGARVYRAFIHSAAAGVLRSRDVSVMLIDADESNSANKSSIELYKEYSRIYQAMGNEKRNIFTCNIQMDSEQVLSPVKTDAVNLELAIGNDNDDRRRILNCLYTKEEIQQNLEGGFYAHPNIGCVFFMAFRHEEFDKCINSIIKQLEKGEDVWVALVGSVFGGTGAAGLPTIFKLISERVAGAGKAERLHMGGILLEPYFTVSGKRSEGDKNIPIEMEEFYANTYDALSYYLTNNKINFESIYLLGQQSPDIVNTEYADCGSRQNNKPHIIELYAALAIDRFFNCPEKGVFGSVREGLLEWKSLPQPEHNAMDIWRLADFTRLQAVFVSEVYRYVENTKKEHRKQWGIGVPQWYRVYNVQRTENRTEIQDIEKYNLLFLDWLYRTNCKYDSNGGLELDPNIKLYDNTLEEVYQLSRDLNEMEKSKEEPKKIAAGDTGKKDIKERVAYIRKHFDSLVNTADHVEFVLDKLMMILSFAGIVPWGAVKNAGGAIQLFCRLAALAGRKVKEKTGNGQ